MEEKDKIYIAEGWRLFKKIKDISFKDFKKFYFESIEDRGQYQNMAFRCMGEVADNNKWFNGVVINVEFLFQFSASIDYKQRNPEKKKVEESKNVSST